jgi:hypothetical protein
MVQLGRHKGRTFLFLLQSFGHYELARGTAASHIKTGQEGASEARPGLYHFRFKAPAGARFACPLPDLFRRKRLVWLSTLAMTVPNHSKRKG